MGTQSRLGDAVDEEAGSLPPSYRNPKCLIWVVVGALLVAAMAYADVASYFCSMNNVNVDPDRLEDFEHKKTALQDKAAQECKCPALPAAGTGSLAVASQSDVTQIKGKARKIIADLKKALFEARNREAALRGQRVKNMKSSGPEKVGNHGRNPNGQWENNYGYIKGYNPEVGNAKAGCRNDFTTKKSSTFVLPNTFTEAFPPVVRPPGNAIMKRPLLQKYVLGHYASITLQGANIMFISDNCAGPPKQCNQEGISRFCKLWTNEYFGCSSKTKVKVNYIEYRRSGADRYKAEQPDMKDITTIYVGDQSDQMFLKRTIASTGVVDFVLDDGSHVSEHIATSFDLVWPAVKSGGIYYIEDLALSWMQRSYNIPIPKACRGQAIGIEPSCQNPRDLQMTGGDGFTKGNCVKATDSAYGGNRVTAACRAEPLVDSPSVRVVRAALESAVTGSGDVSLVEFQDQVVAIRKK